MTEELMTTDPVPNFICPTCGYFGDTTWDSYQAEELGEERLSFGCRELLGMILIDHLQGSPFQLACLHPDGTYGYAPERTPGKRADVDKVAHTTRLGVSEEAQDWLGEQGLPLHVAVGDAAITQKVSRILAGLLYATYNPLEATHDLINFGEHYHDEGLLLADLLAGLSDASPLAHDATDRADANFTALQRELWDLLQPHYWLLVDAGLDWALAEWHVLTPAEIREALADDANKEAQP
jgi:hypothetical protein